MAKKAKLPKVVRLNEDQVLDRLEACRRELACIRSHRDEGAVLNEIGHLRFLLNLPGSWDDRDKNAVG